MTIIRRDSMDSPFNAWIRAQQGLDSGEFQISVTDSDLWVHRYAKRNERASQGVATDIRKIQDHIMLVEIKAFCRKVPYAQRDTLNVVNELLRLATVTNNKRRAVKIPDRRTPGASRFVRCFGVHYLELSADRPDNSDQIIWDQKAEISEERLVEILRFDYDPDYPSKLMDTRRHHRVVTSPVMAMGLEH